MQVDISSNKVLVAKSADLIGSNLFKALLPRQNKMFCLVNFTSVKRENIIDYSEALNFTLIERYIRNLEDIFSKSYGLQITKTTPNISLILFN